MNPARLKPTVPPSTSAEYTISLHRASDPLALGITCAVTPGDEGGGPGFDISLNRPGFPTQTPVHLARSSINEARRSQTTRPGASAFLNVLAQSLFPSHGSKSHNVDSTPRDAEIGSKSKETKYKSRSFGGIA